MVVLKLFLLLVFITNGFSEKSCSDESVDVEEIHRWWFDEMSVKKPVKCKMPEDWKFKKDQNYEIATQIVAALNNRVPVRSYPCNKPNGELSIKFRFTGKIENGILTGPGKLIFDGKDISYSDEACLIVVQFGVGKPDVAYKLRLTGWRDEIEVEL